MERMKTTGKEYNPTPKDIKRWKGTKINGLD